METRRTSRAAGVSSWQVVARDIRRDVESGVLRPLERLRSEKQLAVEYGVGLWAVRRAIRSLRDAGLLVSKPRSGVFVAGFPAVAAARVEAPSNGLHALDIVHAATCHLRFTVAGWNATNKAVWEQICREAALFHPFLAVEPLFPINEREFAHACRTSDIFMTAMMDAWLHRGARGDVEWLDAAELSAWPLDPRYVEAVRFGDKAIGVPLSGTLLVGGLNPSLTPLASQDALLAARSWDAALPLLARLGAEEAPAAAINLQPSCTLNLFQHLTHIGGPLVDPDTRRVRLGRRDFRDALAGVQAHRTALLAQRRETACRTPSDCCVYFDLTYQFPRMPALFSLRPWLFPLGEQGAYMENINAAIISRATPYPEECRHFLRYLLSDPVQRTLTAMPGEHPVSAGIADPFAGYTGEWKRVLPRIKERSRLCFEHVPGYSEFLVTIFLPLAGQFLRGEIDAGRLTREAEERGRRFFSRRTPLRLPAGGAGAPAAWDGGRRDEGRAYMGVDTRE